MGRSCIIKHLKHMKKSTIDAVDEFVKLVGGKTWAKALLRRTLLSMPKDHKHK